MIDPTTLSLVSIVANAVVVTVVLLSMRKASADREALIRSLAIAVRLKGRTMLNGGTPIRPRHMEEAESYLQKTVRWGKE